MRRLRVSVVRSVFRRCASADTVAGAPSTPLRAVSIRLNCVPRSPLGARMSSYSCVILRDRLRIRKQLQRSRGGRSAEVDVDMAGARWKRRCALVP
jgi:hypothetical protein